MAERQSTCVQCCKQFTYRIARGTGNRKYCSTSCANDARRHRAEQAKEKYPECSVAGCADNVRSAGSEFCERHYGQLRRNGHLGCVRKPGKLKIRHSHGYVLMNAPSHPLAARRGDRLEYEHRIVFYDANGDGPFTCHWCGAHLTWDTMHVDHLNDVRDDNRLENLVASCPGCNQARGQKKATRSIRRSRATWIEYGGEKLTATEWADRLGIDRVSLKWRLKNGWSVERALTTPRGKTGPRAQRR